MEPSDAGPVLNWPLGGLPTWPEPGEIHVWAASLDGPSDQECVRGWLSPRETRTAAAFRTRRDCDRYLAAHGFLRETLGRYLDRSPHEIRFVIDPNGKPGLPPGDTALAFNLSHSETLALLAVGADGCLGVDVERIRDDPGWLQVAEELFSAQEQAGLARLGEAERLAGFFACWTRKEALLKASGLGLRVPLDGFSVDVQPEAAEPRTVGLGPLVYSLQSLAPAPGYVGCVASIGAARRLMLRSYRPAGDARERAVAAAGSSSH